MTSETRYRISIAAAAAVLVVLIGLTVSEPPGAASLLPGLLFGGLLLLTMTFGVLLVEGEVSLLPMTSVTACLVMGPLATGWAVFAAACAHGLIRYRWGERLGLTSRPAGKEMAGLTAANATMHTASILAGGLIFRAAGGGTPLLAVGRPQILPLVLLGLGYLGANYAIAALYIAARRRAAFRSYLRSLPNLVFYEGAPLLFAPLAALIYTRLGLAAFFAFALILVATSFITRSLAFTGRRLGRRVKELDSLRAVGQTLSASLDVETILRAIYDQAATLMPTQSFYIALYDPDTDEVSFPLAMENGERVRWRSRRAGNGLTEHVLRTRAPLLIRGQVEPAVKALGLEHIGRPAACWLGVPLTAGTEPLGVIAVQSFDQPGAYDASHQEVLATIAAQAAVAIQNARLYARTDEALARRVQELGSILTTTHEGMLLLDLDWRVLAANRALAGLVGVAQGELVGKTLRDGGPLSRPGQGEPLAALIGYTPGEMQADCEALARGEEWTRKQIVIPGPHERHVERSLTPVRDREGGISGWLVVLRDVTEEIQLARLKEDMTRMLIHDLRSPLTVIKASLDMMALAHDGEGGESFARLLAMAQRGSDQLLRLVNDLLDISRLEERRQQLAPEPAAARALLEEAAARLAPLLASAQIAVEIAADPGLPLLHVDRGLIERVLNNLLHNAIKFTPDGGRISLWARLDPDRAPAAMLVGVSDTGPGIPAAEQSRLFEKFRRLDSTRGRWTGSGLGLSFCKLAVEQHGGRIWVESQEGRGSTFMLTLPIHPFDPGHA